MEYREEFYHPDIKIYSENHTTKEDSVLQKINRNTHLKMLRPRMLSGAYQGTLLTMVSKMIHPFHILEIGTFVGYSAICLAKGLKQGGWVDTIEKEEELEEFIKKNISEAGMSESIHLYMGDAIQIIPTLKPTYDLIFLDADKRNYVAYYHLLLPVLKSGGYLIADNVLWNGKVCYDQPKGDKESHALKAFNDIVMEDKSVENILLPIRDGIMLVRKK